MIGKQVIALWVGVVPLAFSLSAGAATSSSTAREQLLGTWTLTASDNVNPDGSRIHLYGDDPQGTLNFDATGHYSLQIMSKVRPQFAANDKSKGTPEEYRASVVGTQCHFGTYTLNEQDHSITLHVEHATYANWEGADLKWPYTIDQEHARFVVPHPSIGGPGVYGEIAYVRTH